MSPADLPAAALAFVNQLSEMDVDVDYVTLRFDSQTRELGLTYSDNLKTVLGLGSNHYTLVSPSTAGGGDGSSGGTLEGYDDATSTFFDPFNQNLDPLSLPLPTAYTLVAHTVMASSDAVVVAVHDQDWHGFYRKLLTAGKRFPVFFETATTVRQRFGFTDSPDLLLTPTAVVIRSGNGFDAMAGWLGRYDQVYSAVLVLQYAAGSVPEEFLS